MEKDQEIYETLLGKKNVKNEEVDHFFSRIVDAIKNPREFPYLIEELCTAFEGFDEKKKNKIRYALVRLQIDSDIRHQEDMQTMTSRKYIAQVLETLLYGELLLERKPEKI